MSPEEARHILAEADLIRTAAEVQSAIDTLAAQITTIFGDQSLPSLGYMNDLLYTAAAIAPASFNDITFGNNITSYYYDNDGQYSSGGWPARCPPTIFTWCWRSQSGR